VAKFVVQASAPQSHALMYRLPKVGDAGFEIAVDAGAGVVIPLTGGLKDEAAIARAVRGLTDQLEQVGREAEALLQKHRSSGSGG
jgi:Na+/H+-translocating membrane pyrophosphatase